MEHIRRRFPFERYRLHHWKEALFVINIMVEVVIVMVKVFVKPPSLICVGYSHQPYQIFPSDPADEGLIRGFINMDASINPRNLGGILLYGGGGGGHETSHSDDVGFQRGHRFRGTCGFVQTVHG